MMLDGKLLRGLFKQERLKPVILKTNEGNVTNLVKLKQLFNTGLTFSLWNDVTLLFMTSRYFVNLSLATQG